MKTRILVASFLVALGASSAFTQASNAKKITKTKK